jgi:DNA primase
MPQVRPRPLTARTGSWRVDTELLRLTHPIVDLVASYGIELRRSGSHFSGRCPFHVDRGRPNMAVFPRSGRWVCFRCDARGDAIAFVQRIDGVSFREAAARLGGDLSAGPVVVELSGRRRAAVGRHAAARPVDTEVLAAAVELYANRLMADETALDYLASRGFGGELLERERIGYAAGGELLPYLVWRGIAPQRARRIGLLDANGQEVMQGRIVFPELRHGRPVWLIGRLLETASDEVPRYLGLPGGKPLLGWDAAGLDLRGACLVEGPTDWLALRMWGVPGLALCGTGASASTLEALKRWDRLYLVLDDDDAGHQATSRLREALGDRAVPVSLPTGVNDPADLAARADGGLLFAHAIRSAR